MKKRYRYLSLLFAITLLLYLIGHFNPYFIEKFYTLTFNKIWIQLLSQFVGWLPFSVFEILIYSLVLLILYRLGYSLYHIFKNPPTFMYWIKTHLIHIFYLSMVLILLFIWEWGFNYQRLPLQHMLALELPQVNTNDLAQLYSLLIEEANTLRPYIAEDDEGHMTIEGGYKNVFSRATLGYNVLVSDYPFLAGSYGKPKAILASSLMNYTGITGIYSPFTGEANVNVAILPQNLPYTTLHEMAHQRGFANEDECNFLAFLACLHHPDADFQYSGYLLALAYTNSALAKINAPLLHELNRQLSPKVLEDLAYNNAFWKQYEGPVEEVSSKVNDTYLKANGISDGTKSYGRMVDLLLSYYYTHALLSFN